MISRLLRTLLRQSCGLCTVAAVSGIALALLHVEALAQTQTQTQTHPPVTEIVIATVNNGHMLTLQKLSRQYETAHPGVRLKWVTLEEGPLRQQVSRDIATGAGRFDILTIGAYEAPIWGGKGWLKALKPSMAYAVDDLLPGIRQTLSVKQSLYALPFYGESSMTMVRQDLLDQAGVSLPRQPTWEQIRQAAARLHDPERGVYGICLRGKPGWGENMTLLTTIVNAHGGQWFDMGWKPQLDSPPWHLATNLYVDLLRRFGPPGAAANGYNENLALFMDGRCAIWVDATVAGSFVNRPGLSKVAGKVSFLQAPIGTTSKGSHWLWAWALGIPSSSQKAAAAQDFIEWATSRDYIQLVARSEGWGAVPSGTRQSTYATPAFQKANAHAEIEREAIATADPLDATLPKSPYVGVQFAAIPEFQGIGTAVGQVLASLLQGPGDVDAALRKAQALSTRRMREAGYLH
jgi:sorbitol/mannitol transport system substrate-binding protein